MKLAIVTGASRGLGQALARELLTRDWTVIGLARGDMAAAVLDTVNAADAVDAATRLDGAARSRFVAQRVDLADPAAAVAAVRTVFAAHAPEADAAQQLCLINNAGVVTPIAPAGRFDVAEAAAAVALNLTTAIALASEFIRLTADLPARRAIVNISSGAAVTAYAGWSVYGATKAGLDQFTRCVAQEQAAQANPLRIAAVAPGVVDTDMQGQVRASTAADFPARQRFVDLKTGGQLRTPAAVAARLIDYLQSPAFGDPPVVDLRTL